MNIIVEELIVDIGSKYALTTLMSKRAREINNGAKILSADVSGKAEVISLREISEHLVHIGAPKVLETETSDSDKGE
jgi:DNA-directed RNA polymerase omega subunit